MGGNGFLTPLLGLFLLLAGASAQECSTIIYDRGWTNNYVANFTYHSQFPFDDLDAVFTFDSPVVDATFYSGASEVLDETHVRFQNDVTYETSGLVYFQFQITYDGDARPQVIAIDVNGQDACEESPAWTTETPYTNPCPETGMGPYDYSQALCMAILFYEAQRSGVLPDDQRVTPWRWDSALDDGSDVGHDLTGGYFDAGDHVKFGFPMAGTVTVLSWALLDFPEGFQQAGQTEYARAAIKWATDYFLKEHTGEYELYGQVGKGVLDHAYWGRPEDMVMVRPAYKIDRENPGTELACETAAALAAASLVFQGVDDAYSAELLEVAKELYAFGDEYRLEYHWSITDAQEWYRSWSGYGDELLWGALWMNRATGEASYLDKAQAAWDEFGLAYGAGQFSWDDKKAGAYALGSMVDSENPQYAAAMTEFLRHIREDATYTPDGLVYLDEWGANRYASNVAFLALWAAKYGDPADSDTHITWATSQINYILGDTGRSYVVGFGVNPPQRPHHRSSSCPLPPTSCTENSWGMVQSGPNPHVLYGALVGGPSEDGTFVDDRQDYRHTEVGCDYNAAFTGVLSAMIELNN